MWKRDPGEEEPRTDDESSGSLTQRRVRSPLRSALFLAALVPPLLVGGVLLLDPVVAGLELFVLSLVGTAVAEIAGYYTVKRSASDGIDLAFVGDVLRDRWQRGVVLVAAIVGVDLVLAFLVVLAVSTTWPAPHQPSTISCWEVDDGTGVDGAVVPIALLPAEQQSIVEAAIDAEYGVYTRERIRFPWTLFVRYEGSLYRCNHWYEQRTLQSG